MKSDQVSSNKRDRDESTPQDDIPTPHGIDLESMPPEDKLTLKRVISGSALGNAVEWFGYGV